MSMDRVRVDGVIGARSLGGGTAAVDAPLRVLIADDEPLARAHLRALLAGDPEVEVVAECGDGRSAVAAALRTAPDLMLLDIQMPELDGLAVAQALGPEREPLVVFTTAYDEHAVEAFAVQAFDYLLKPLQRERVLATLARVRARIRELRASVSAAAAPTVGRRPPGEDRLALRVDGRILLVRTDDVDWLEAMDDRVRVHVGRQAIVVRDTLTRLEGRLPMGRFLRVHRSSLVNVSRIRELQPWFQGDFVVVLGDGTRITTGRSYRRRVQEFLAGVR